jgi:hypothetical protein
LLGANLKRDLDHAVLAGRLENRQAIQVNHRYLRHNGTAPRDFD